MKICLMAALIAFCLMTATASTINAASRPKTLHSYLQLPKPGARVSLPGNGYFTYGFTKPPKLGMRIMKVEIFTREGKPDTSFTVKGDADMPSMRGVHSTGDQEFVVSAKGEYLLPVNLVMPGDWEVRLSLAKNGQTLLRGAYLFDL